MSPSTPMAPSAGRPRGHHRSPAATTADEDEPPVPPSRGHRCPRTAWRTYARGRVSPKYAEQRQSRSQSHPLGTEGRSALAVSLAARDHAGVSGDIVARWPVVLERAVAPDQLGAGSCPSDAALLGWCDDALGAYLDRCASLRAEQASGGTRVVTSAPSFDRSSALGPGTTVLIGVSVTELRASSLDLAIRIRGVAEDGRPVVINGRVVVAIVDAATGSAVAFPDSLRAEVVAGEVGRRNTAR